MTAHHNDIEKTLHHIKTLAPHPFDSSAAPRLLVTACHFELLKNACAVNGEPKTEKSPTRRVVEVIQMHVHGTYCASNWINKTWIIMHKLCSFDSLLNLASGCFNSPTIYSVGTQGQRQHLESNSSPHGRCIPQTSS